MSRGEVTTRFRSGTLTDVVRTGPVDRAQLRFRRRVLLILLVLVLIVVGWLVWRFTSDRPVEYAEITEHFKYGSIGAEPGGSLTNPVGGVLPPYWVFRVLPDICPDRLPGDGYESLGLLYEEGHDLPIGVSRRWRLGFDQVGLNCAVCHTGTVRETPSSERRIVLGMPANQLEIEELFRFILDCSLDPRLTADNLLGRIEAAGGDLGWLDRFLYRAALVNQVKLTVLGLQGRIGPLLQPDVTPWGAGRVDTFNPYKSIQFNWQLTRLPHDELMGASDYPSLWNQEPREGMDLHWDGNNSSLAERNLSASLGAGVTPITIDHEALGRVREWALTLPPPDYPFAIDEALASRGAVLYERYCADCHADHRFKDGTTVGSQVGTVAPIDEIQTDPFRLHSYTWDFSTNQYSLYPASEYQFTHFRKTNGYANQPLDGIWARAPYLHNGSVPTMRDLLEPPENRPATFFRGYDVYDQERLGFVHSVGEENGKRYFLYDTSLKGNGNQGHHFGVDLAAEDKDAIVEYMKKF